MKIDFEFQSEYGTFRDALNLPDDHGLSDSELDSMKQQRFNSWLDFIKNPPVIEQLVEDNNG